jgi:hypothetical protein
MAFNLIPKLFLEIFTHPVEPPRPSVSSPATSGAPKTIRLRHPDASTAARGPALDAHGRAIIHQECTRWATATCSRSLGQHFRAWCAAAWR